MENRIDELKRLLQDFDIDHFTNNGWLTKNGERFLELIIQELEHLRQMVDRNA